MERAYDSDVNVRLSHSVRALAIVLAIGISLGFALGMAVTPLSSVRYFHDNYLVPKVRQRLLAFILGGGLTATLFSVGYLFSNFSVPKVASRLYHAARRLSPLALTGFLPLLFRCEAWKGHDLPFLTLVLLFGAAAWATCTSALRAASSRNSSSCPAWMLAWLLHHLR